VNGSAPFPSTSSGVTPSSSTLGRAAWRAFSLERAAREWCRPEASAAAKAKCRRERRGACATSRSLAAGSARRQVRRLSRKPARPLGALVLLQEALQQVLQHLEEQGVAVALLGGLAVSVWAEPTTGSAAWNGRQLVHNREESHEPQLFDGQLTDVRRRAVPESARRARGASNARGLPVFECV
jgi:hypothetical protein